MTTFLLDLWHDLREKRLWPVAVGLAAAAVAIPVVMLKPASTATPLPVVAAKPPAPDTLPAVQVDTSPTHNSKLETFSQRNPFKPLSDLKKTDKNGNAPASTTSTSGGQPASSGTPSSSGSPSSGSSTPSTGGTPSSPSTPSTPSTPSAPSSPGSQPLKWFRYVADIRFGTTGKLKDMKGIGSLTLLPDSKTGSIVFMGVGDNGQSAIFFVSDPAFTPSGEGECNDKKDCRFIRLTLDPKKNDEKFTSLDGSIVYHLKLLKLKRELIPASQAKGKTVFGASAVPGAKVAGGTADDTISQASNAVLPRLLDLPAVAQQAK